MKREKFENLRQRMVRHVLVADVAIVILTAKELEDLLNIAEPHIVDDDRCEPGMCMPRLKDELEDNDYSDCIACGHPVDMRG